MSHHIRKLFWSLLAPALVLLLTLSAAQVLMAQKDTGGITGTVTDQSGATVSGAKVTITDVDRGTSVSTTTDSQGEYNASPLKIGRS
ncbi:MAG: carboxypeptidase-like regulatory domain-containing protein, partial [Candidatus Acidiferrum sp.]